MISFGVVQGRLVQSPNGELQCFPGNLWPDEFVIARENGIKFIELLAFNSINFIIASAPILFIISN